jgi:hypothetical protein
MARTTPRVLAACAALAAGVLRGAGVAAQSATPSGTTSSSATTTRTASGTASLAPGLWISTLAGNGLGSLNTVGDWSTGSFSGDEGPATNAGLQFPRGLAVDGGGNVLIADTGNHRIRRVAAGTGVITTVAGNGVDGFSGDGGPGTSASLSAPRGLAVDGGNVLIADTYNHRIRRMAAGTGVITTVAGNGVAGFSGDGGPGTSARLIYPKGVAVDGGGNVFIADSNRIRRLAAGTGVITTVAGNGVYGFSGDGGPGTNASLNTPTGLAVDVGGNVFIADYNNRRIRRLAAGTGVITTVAGNGTWGFSGDGGSAMNAFLSNPSALSLDLSGNIYVVLQNRIRRVDFNTGAITTHVGIEVDPYNMCQDDYGNQYSWKECIDSWRFCGDGGPAMSACLNSPSGLAVDRSGNLLIADTDNNRIRRLTWVNAISPSITATPSQTPSTSSYCMPSLFRPLPRTDLVGSLVGTALAPGEPVRVSTDAACRQECCNAPACDGYAFDADGAKWFRSAGCYLYVNVTQLVPSSTMASGLRESVLL